MSNITINSLPTASTIDATQDILPIYTASGAATQGINRNTLLGLTSAPVGLTDSQTLTSKVLTSPTINGATLSGTLSGTYTIGGTPTFPASVVTLTGSQTLTNKVLTSPTINSPTITNATISADTVTGFTSANNGTLYGISIVSSQITSNLTMTGTATVSGLLTASNGFTISSGTVTFPTGSLSTQALTGPYKFSVYRAAAANSGNGAFALITFDTKNFDTGTNYSTSTGLFTAPVAGFYQINAGLAFGSNSADLIISIYKNGAEFRRGGRVKLSATLTGITVSDLIQLAANDTLSIEAFGSATTALDISGTVNNYFSGFLASKT